MQAPKAELAWIAEVNQMKKNLADIKKALYGNSTLSKREKESYPSITMRIELVADNLISHTEAPTQSEKRSLEIAEEELAQQQTSYYELKTQMEKLVIQLRGAKSPFFPVMD